MKYFLIFFWFSGIYCDSIGQDMGMELFSIVLNFLNTSKIYFTEFVEIFWKSFIEIYDAVFIGRPTFVPLIWEYANFSVMIHLFA